MPIKRHNYPANWPQIRQRILDRAGHRCESCGVREYTVGYRSADGELVPLIVGENYAEANALRHRMMEVMSRRLIVIRLTTAHLDHDEWNHGVTDDRLACLCERCHFHHDQPDNQLRKKYGTMWRRYQLPLFAAAQII